MSKRAAKIPYLDKAPKPGHVYIDLGSGVEGPYLSIGDHRGGYRLAGPKPWGGGTTTHRFEVRLSELREQLERYGATEAGKSGDQG